MNRVLEISKKLVWGLTALSITSCLIRNDYNVIFSFLLLIILNNFFNQNPKLFTKIIVQILGLLTVMDVIWLFVMMPSWSHDSTSDKNEFWKSLSAMHTLGITLAFFELIMKVLIALYLAYDFKQKNPQEIKKPSPQSETEQRGQTEMGSKSDFVNPY